MAATQPGRRRLIGRLIIALLLAVALVIAAAVAAVAILSLGGRGSIGLTLFEKDAGDLLEQVIGDSELTVTQASAVDREEADGPQPDMAMQRLVVAATAATAQAGFRQACRRAGLGAPDAMTLRTHPDTLCEGGWNGGTATVSVTLRCARSCIADLSVYHLWF